MPIIPPSPKGPDANDPYTPTFEDPAAAGLGVQLGAPSTFDPEELLRQKRIEDQLAAQGRSGYGGGYGGGGGGGGSRKQRIANLAAELSDRAKQLGLSLTDTEITELAKEAITNRWSEAVINDKLLISVDWQKVTGGDLTAGVDLIKSVGASFLVAVTDQQAREWSLRMAQGEMTQTGLASMLQAQARARYAWMGKLIDQGVKPADYFAPIRNIVAQTLEMSPESIDLMDPRWMKMLEVRDERTGELRAATMREAMVSARNEPEWARTGQAQQGIAQLGRNLAMKMGVAA